MIKIIILTYKVHRIIALNILFYFYDVYLIITLILFVLVIIVIYIINLNTYRE